MFRLNICRFQELSITSPYMHWAAMHVAPILNMTSTTLPAKRYVCNVSTPIIQEIYFPRVVG